MPGPPGHLIKRFFEVLWAKPLSREEGALVETWLDGPLSDLFFSQPEADQRHGYQAALSVLGEGVTDGEVVAAALLHDIGKRHARLGVIGRSIASLFILAHLPLTRSMRLYRDHGELGAHELEALGAATLVVEFARHHHGPRPLSVAPETWETLKQADLPRRR